MLLGIVYLVILFLAAIFLNYDASQIRLLAWLAFNQFLLSFILYLRSNISGFLMFKTDSFLSVLDRLLMILICGLLLWGGIFQTPFRIEWFVYAQSTAYAVTALTAFFIVVKKANFKKLNWNWPFFLMIIKQSAPFALLVLLMTFYNRLDPVMLESMLPEKAGNEQAGIYASGFRLLDAANMFAYLFAVLLVPIFSRMLKEKQHVGEMVKLSATLIISIASIVSIGLFFYSHETISLLYDSHIDESTAVFRLLIPGFIAVSTVNIFGTLLTANGNFKHLNIIALSGLLINFLLNFWLIPVKQATGSAIASLVTQFTMAILQVIVVQKIFRFKINTRYIVTFASFITGIILLNFISKQVPLPIPFLPVQFAWLGSFLLVIIASVFLAVILRLWNIGEFLRIIRQDR
jgi:O-antigen/teichoic acid export membrane protein